MTCDLNVAVKIAPLINARGDVCGPHRSNHLVKFDFFGIRLFGMVGLAYDTRRIGRVGVHCWRQAG